MAKKRTRKSKILIKKASIYRQEFVLLRKILKRVINDCKQIKP